MGETLNHWKAMFHEGVKIGLEKQKAKKEKKNEKK
jgi:hypothetical protein